MHVLVLTKADPIMKEQSCKRGMVGASGAGGIEMILAVLGPFSLACGFRTNGLSLKEKHLCKILSSSKGLSWCIWRKLWWGLDLMHHV